MKELVLVESFSEHWGNGLGPLALQHQPAFWRYVQNRILERLADDIPAVDGIDPAHLAGAPIEASTT